MPSLKEKLHKKLVGNARDRISKTGEVKYSAEDFEAAKGLASDRGKRVKEMQAKRAKKG